MNAIPPRFTVSLCPTCYLEIPAVIHVEDVVRMEKTCPVHGAFSATVEVSPGFYDWCRVNPGTIYPGHLVDITTKCNLRCKYCYYDLGKEDFDIGAILNECRVNLPPFILTGGEPTMRPDLPDIIRQTAEIGPTYVLTNGTKFLDRKYLKAVAEHVHQENGFHGIGLSFHPEAKVFDEVVEALRFEGIKAHTVFFVIDALEQLNDVLAFAKSHPGEVEMIRVKCASKLWDEQRPSSRIFTSQVLEWFKERDEIRDVFGGGKASYFPFWGKDGQAWSIISWYDVNNVDLLDIACPPTYRAKNGEVADFVKAMLINEGMGKGWLKGKPYPA